MIVRRLCLAAMLCASCARAEEVAAVCGSSDVMRWDTRGLCGVAPTGVTAHWGGEMSASETWTKDAVHVVYGRVTLPTNVTLTVESGAIVKFVGGGIHALGLLVAEGATFTDFADDSVGGDTDGNRDAVPYTSYAIDGNVQADADTRFRCRDMACGFAQSGDPDVIAFDTRGLCGEVPPRTVAHAGGELLESETWAAGTVHVVYGTLVVPTNVTLTVASGAVVKFAGGGIYALGQLIADGAIFTDLADDSVGGDTDGDANGVPYTSYFIKGNVEADAGTQFRCRDLSEQLVQDCGTDAFRFDTRGLLGAVPSGMVAHWGGRLETDETWPAGATHVVYGTMTFPTNVTLTVASGAVVKFVGGGILAEGPLVAEGAAFTDLDDDSVGGDTRGDGWTQPFASYSIEGDVRDDAATIYRCLDTHYGFLMDGASGSLAFDTRGFDASEMDGTREHSGEMTSDETWGADETHVVYGTLSVVAGVTLTIEPGAVVKFVGGGLAVDGLCIARGVTFTDLDDASRGASRTGGKLPYTSYALEGNFETDATTVILCRRGLADGLADAGQSRVFRMETEVEGVRFAGEPREITFSTVWDGSSAVEVTETRPDGSTVVLTNGTADCEGVFLWDAGETPGLYTLRHVTDTNELTASFYRLFNATAHDGSITGTNVWASGVVHVISRSMSVRPGGVLFIEPGAIVKLFPDVTLTVETGGLCVAEDVIFTSVYDSSVGGDTLSDGGATEPGDGDYLIVGYVRDNATTEYRHGTHSLSGTISGDETWDANRVYVIDGTLTVAAGASLTIPRGTVVKFTDGSVLTIENGATCVAEGVVFTHIADDTVGGDTMGDGDETSPKMDAYGIEGVVCDDEDTEYRYSTQTLDPSIGGTVRLKGHKVYLANSSITVNSGATLTLLPGAIIKFASGCSMTVNGTLDAQGTRAAPIVFTSMKDDEWGGDTNEDGEKTYAQAGDWYQIRVAGAANFNYCQVLYNSSSENYGGLEAYGGTVNFDNSVIAHTKYECVNAHSSGTLTARNSVFRDSSLGFGYYGSGKVKACNCVFADLTVGIRQSGKTLTNCVFCRCLSFTDQNGDGSAFKNCAFYNPKGFGAQSYAKVGSNGNIWGDPKFADPDNGDFRIAADSPCIDAGDGTVAPELDYWGQPRMDAKGAAAIGVPNADGICPDIGIYEYPGKVAAPVADLAALSVTAPATAVPGEEIALTYVVTNRGAAEAVGMVRDRFQLRGADAALGGQTIAAGEVQQLYSLAAGAAVTLTARVKCPTVRSGNWTLGVTVNAERDVFEQVTANNAGWASEVTSVELAGLAAGESRVSVAAGSATGFVVSEGVRTLRVASDVALDRIAVYGANGAVPPSSEGGTAAVRLDDGSWLLVLPEATADEKGYVVIENGGASEVALKVTAEAEKLAVLGVAPSRVAAVDGVSVTITGTGLAEGQTVTLGGRAATRVTKVNTAQIVATFNLAGLAASASTVEVCSDGVSPSQGSVEVYKTTQGPKLEAKLVLPSSVRDGRIYTAWIEYANVGDEPMMAPLFTVKRTDSATKLKILMSDGFATDPLYIVGICSGYPAGVLAAGDSGRIPFYFMPSGTYRLELSHAKDETAATEYRQFADTADYRQAVADAATRLSARGKAEYRVRECVNFVLAERASRDVAAISGTVLDATTREPLSGVTVSAVMTNGTTRTASCTADADGRFSLAMLSDGDWRLSVDGGAVSGGDVVTIKDQKDVNGHELTAWLLATVSGTVLTADTHEPIEGAAVRLHLNNGKLPSDETTTDVSGAFKLEGVVSGTYALVVNSKDGYVGDVVTNVVLSLGDSYAAGVFELSKGAVLYGTVTQDGGIVTNGTVYAYFEDGSAARAVCSTNGTYCFDGLPPYAYRVRYAGDGMQADFVDVTLGAGETKELDLMAKATPLFFPIRSHGYGTLTTQFMVADPVLATNATAFAWDFDNDGTVDSTEEEPEWTYTVVGNYSVKLVASTPQGARMSLYENCVTVEEAIENILNANAFRVDEAEGIDCTALGENTLTLVGLPPMPLAAGVVVGGKFGDEWYIRRITGVTQSDTTYTLTTEEATLDDLYASYCFTTCQEVEPVEDSPKHLLQAANANSAKSKMRLMAKSKKSSESVKVVGGAGMKVSGSFTPRIYVICEETRKNGYSYSCIGLAGEVALSLTAELFGELGAQYNVPVPLSFDIPTPVPFVDVSPEFEFGINIGASGKASGTVGVTACPRIKMALEKRNEEGWRFANPLDGFNFDWICQAEFSGKAGFELYAKAGGKVKAFKVMNVGADQKFSIGAELSGGTKSASKFEIKYVSTISTEANALDTSKIPLVGEWLDFKIGISGEWETGSLVLTSIRSPEPDFVISPDQGDAPLAVQFRDDAKSGELSVNLAAVKGFGLGGTVTHQPPTAWEWDLYFEKSTLQSPSYTYHADGEYEISQKVRGVFLHPGYAAKKKLYVGKEKPPEDEQQKDDQGGDTSKQSWDPNEMDGPLGAGDPETERFVKPGEWMDYTIYFENRADADVPAQEVFVDAQLSEYLDWSTFEMGEVAFNNQNVTVLAGLKNGFKTVAQNGADHKVQLSVTFDEKSGAAHWYLRSYDPSRFEYNYWPAAVDAGFLPPNDETHRGEGHITYRVRVREDAQAGVKIDAAATIVFDQNEPIPTDPAWWNMVGQSGPDVPWGEDEAFSANAANTYEGFLWDEKGELVGVVQVKTTKQGVKTTADKKTKVKTVTTNITATATVTDANGKKWSYSKGSVEIKSGASLTSGRDSASPLVGVVTGLKCTTKGCPVSEFGVRVGANGMEGVWGEYAIFGARNGMGTKGDAMMAALEAYKGKWSVTLSAPRTAERSETAEGREGAAGTVRLQLDVQAKGVVKIAGNWESGAKVSASAQMIMGDGFAYVPVMVKSTKTSPALNALLRVESEEVVLVSGYLPAPVAEDGDGTVLELLAGGRTAAALEVVGYLAENPVKAGAAYVGRVAVNELAYPAKFTQKGLPTGLKIDAATGVVSGTPTKPGEYEVTFTATSSMNSKSNDAVKVSIKIENYVDGLIPVEDYYGPYTPGVSYTVTIPAAGGCTVSGLPTGMKWTAKDIKAKDGTVKTPANSVYGIPTKPGKYTVYFKKSVSELNAKGKSVKVTHTATATFEVSGYPTITLLPSLAIAGSDPVSVAEGAELSFFVGVRQSFAIDLAGTLDGVGTTVSAKGLPTGLKLVKKAVYVDPSAKNRVVDHYEYVIEGVPTKASSLDKQKNVVPSHVTLTASNKYKWSGTFAFDITVVALPKWAYGTFNGGNTNGMATLTVSNVGKVSGKWMSEGLTWTLSAASYAAYYPDEVKYVATVQAKCGKETKTIEVEVTQEGVTGLSAPVAEDRDGTVFFEAWRNGWKEEPLKTLAKDLKGKTVSMTASRSEGAAGTVLLTVGASGAVTAKGTFVTGFDEKRQKDITYSASCSTVLIPTAEAGVYRIYLYFPPKSGKFDGFSACESVMFAP